MAIITSIDCTLPRPDIVDLKTQIKTELSTRLLGGAPVLPMSAEDVLAFVMAGTVNLMHGFVTQALKENDPKTMCCDNLITYGAMHGIDLKAATRAKGYVAITGIPGTPISSNIRFVGASSREYKIDQSVTTNPVVLDPTGGAVLRVTAALPGSAYNLAPGSELTVSTTFPGIDMDATVVGSGITGGTADETCDELRARVINTEASGAVTTNLAWYMQMASRYPGVTRVCDDECEDCCDPSFITLYPFMEGVYGDMQTAPYGVPPQPVLDEMTEWMWGHEPGKGQGLAPVGIAGKFDGAIPTKVHISASCYGDCPGSAPQSVIDSVALYIRNTYCVGSAICKEQLRAAVMRAIGPDACPSMITLAFENFSREDEGWVYMMCGHFLVLGDVQLTPASP
jgi:Baseplate J-like protein